MPKWITIPAGPLLGFLLFLLAQSHGLEPVLCRMAMITAWMAVWWITEAVEIGVTSLLPFVLMPLMNIMKAEEVSMYYMEQTIFLFVGGFFLAYAMEKWNLHHRIAYRIILFTGSSPSRILAGVMLTAFLVSMWISNTATTLMLVAAVTAIVQHKELFDERSHGNIAAACLIALAYSATIGGMATIVGTPTNMIFTGFFEEHYPDAEPVSFLRWCRFGIPFSFAMIAAGFLILKKIFNIKNDVVADRSFIKDKYDALGKISFEEKTVVFVFATTALLWFTRTGFDFGTVEIKGWDVLFPKGFIKDSTVAILMSMMLFLIPSISKKGSFLLEWYDVKKLPFHIILLFGGGFALASGIEVSGLGDFLALQLQFFGNYPLWVIIIIIAALVTFLSELASNVATITLMLPILASLAEAININPIKLMIPATFAASFGFMLTIATAPNTIVYATGYVPAKKMLLTGIFMNVVGIALMIMFMMLVGF